MGEACERTFWRRCRECVRRVCGICCHIFRFHRSFFLAGLTFVFVWRWPLLLLSGCFFLFCFCYVFFLKKQTPIEPGSKTGDTSLPVENLKQCSPGLFCDKWEETRPTCTEVFTGCSFSDVSFVCAPATYSCPSFLMAEFFSVLVRSSSAGFLASDFPSAFVSALSSFSPVWWFTSSELAVCFGLLSVCFSTSVGGTGFSTSTGGTSLSTSACGTMLTKGFWGDVPGCDSYNKTPL